MGSVSGGAVPGPGGRRAIAVDGKTLRGSGDGQQPGFHLLAALDHAHRVVLGQVEVGAKTNEIPLFTTPARPPTPDHHEVLNRLCRDRGLSRRGRQ